MLTSTEMPFEQSNVTNQSLQTQDGQRPELSPFVPSIMFASGVFGNSLALLVLFLSTRSKKRTVFYRLVGILAIVDLSGTICLSPVTLLQYSHRDRWYGGQPLCDYFSFMMIFFGFASMFIVIIMALDRYFALIHPYVYCSKFTWTRIKLLTIGMLLFAAIFALFPIMGIGRNIVHFPYTWCFFDCRGKRPQDSVFTYSYAGVGFLAILFLAYTNMSVIVTLTKMHMVAHVRKPSCHNIHVCISSEEVQMIIFLVGVVLVFVCCWAPLMTVIVIEQSMYSTTGEQLELYVVRLASLNQILDPWIYILLRRELFSGFYDIVKKYICIAKARMTVVVADRSDSGNECTISMTHGTLRECECSDTNFGVMYEQTRM